MPYDGEGRFPSSSAASSCPTEDDGATAAVIGRSTARAEVWADKQAQTSLKRRARAATVRRRISSRNGSPTPSPPSFVVVDDEKEDDEDDDDGLSMPAVDVPLA